MRISNHELHGYVSRFRQQLHHWLSAWLQHRRRIRAIAELRGLDRHALQDIGLDRSQIVSVVDELLAREKAASASVSNARQATTAPVRGFRGRVAGLG